MIPVGKLEVQKEIKNIKSDKYVEYVNKWLNIKPALCLVDFKT